MKFNHEETHPLKALGSELTTTDLSQNIMDVLSEYSNNDECKKRSHLSELIFNKLSQEEILFLATMEVDGKVKQFKKLIDELKEAKSTES